MPTTRLCDLPGGVPGRVDTVQPGTRGPAAPILSWESNVSL